MMQNSADTLISFYKHNDAMVLSNPIEQKSPCVIQDIVPSGAAAMLTITYIHIQTKQGNGYR